MSHISTRQATKYMLQCVAVYYRSTADIFAHSLVFQRGQVYECGQSLCLSVSALAGKKCVAVCCRVLQCVTVCCIYAHAHKHTHK